MEKLILTSGVTLLKTSCKSELTPVITNASNVSRYDPNTSKNENFYFNLKAVMEKLLGQVKMYSTESGRNNGIDLWKSNAPGLKLLILTA